MAARTHLPRPVVVRPRSTRRGWVTLAPSIFLMNPLHPPRFFSLNPPSQCTLLTHPLNKPCNNHPLSTHPLHTLKHPLSSQALKELVVAQHKHSNLLRSGTSGQNATKHSPLLALNSATVTSVQTRAADLSTMCQLAASCLLSLGM